MTFSRPNKSDWTLFFIVVTMVGLVWSKFLISQGTIWLSAIAIFSWHSERKFPLGINPSFIDFFRNIRDYLPQLTLILFFLLVLAGGIGSTDVGYWLERVRIRLPFLAFPLVFLILPKLSSRQYKVALYSLIGMVMCTAVAACVNYFIHFQEISEMVRTGKAIPVPMNHIRFSLLLSLSIFASFYLANRLATENFLWKRFLYGTALIQVICLHLLAVRSGLLVFYVVAFIEAVRFLLQSRRYLIGGAMLLCLMLTPFAAYKFHPGFRTKIQYTLWDYGQFVQNKGQNYSDAERLTSILVGLKIGNEHPWFGVGTGDVFQEVHRTYHSTYPNYTYPKIPHNQFVMTYASNGLLGLLVFLFAFFFPLWYQQGYRKGMLVTLSVILFMSFMVESTLETSQGATFFAFLFAFFQMQNGAKQTLTR